MARRRTALPTGYYVVETRPGVYTPFHQVEGMMFYAGTAPGALVPIGPSYSTYLLAARFTYDRAGVPWESRKRVSGGASSQVTAATHGSAGQVSQTDTRGVVSDGMAERPRKRASPQRDSGGSTRSIP